MNEIERIKEVYEKRKEKISPHLYSFFNPANLFMLQRREWELLKLLKKFGINSFEDKKILDIGCGTGGEIRNFIQYGATLKNLYGIDLLEDRIETAKKLSPNINLKCANAVKLPYENESFDIVIQFTVFTSILNFEMKKAIANEMLRVLKSDGVIIWYDYFMDNPKNLDVKGVKKKEIYEMFFGCSIYLKKITLAPPITRAIAPYSILICCLLEKLRIVNTHYLGMIRKNKLLFL